MRARIAPLHQSLYSKVERSVIALDKAKKSNRRREDEGKRSGRRGRGGGQEGGKKDEAEAEPCPSPHTLHTLLTLHTKREEHEGRKVGSGSSSSIPPTLSPTKRDGDGGRKIGSSTHVKIKDEQRKEEGADTGRSVEGGGGEGGKGGGAAEGECRALRGGGPASDVRDGTQRLWRK
jgi:hypothetical protein